MTDPELVLIIEDNARNLKLARDILNHAGYETLEAENAEDGLDKVLAEIKKALPEKLRETAYALACDVAAADSKVSQEEARLLDLIRYSLSIGKLPAAAIERGARLVASGLRAIPGAGARASAFSTALRAAP